MSVTIAVESVRNPGIARLLALSDAYMDGLYPPEGNFAFSLDELDVPAISFAVARDPAGTALACGGLKFCDDGTAELKRLFVDPAARGQGLGRAMMAFLEDLAMGRGVVTINLETGPLNTEAVALYGARGYAVCGPFPPYEPNPWSLFMTRTLSPAAPPAPATRPLDRSLS